MIKAIVSDFSRVLFHYKKDKNYLGSLNSLHDQLSTEIKDYKVLDHFELNQKLLNHYKAIRQIVPVHLFTQGHVHNTPELRIKLKPFFDSILSADEYHLHKASKDAYEFIAKKLQLHPDEILFIDDQGPYIKAAQEAGLQTLQFKNMQQLISQLRRILQIA